MRSLARILLTKSTVSGSLIALVVVVALTLVVLWRFGSIGNALAYFDGQSVGVDNPLRQLDLIKADQPVQVTFSLTNLQSEPIKIVGATTSCSCVLPPDIPITLPPLASTPFTVTFTAPGKDQEFQQEINVYFDGPTLPLQLKLYGVAR